MAGVATCREGSTGDGLASVNLESSAKTGRRTLLVSIVLASNPCTVRLGRVVCCVVRTLSLKRGSIVCGGRLESRAYDCMSPANEGSDGPPYSITGCARMAGMYPIAFRALNHTTVCVVGTKAWCAVGATVGWACAAWLYVCRGRLSNCEGLRTTVKLTCGFC
ncbi:hypothetical protein EXIGLDRAFT_123033 [Exidia glandulosa HHB12029]|uniref:Uncharacterized protein n=1 Tax=Exidia glandulosa HHB12029 TaxID=1314781 RepID=A0A165NIV3_EXIGL|nr:hypothetical protein EXIGLDRAFT_123033 [Exidia glandulosa HHB12029]